MQRGKLILVLAVVFVQRYISAADDLNRLIDLSNPEFDEDDSFHMMMSSQIVDPNDTEKALDEISNGVLPAQQEETISLEDFGTFSGLVSANTTPIIHPIQNNSTLEPHPVANPNSTIVNSNEDVSGRCGLKNHNSNICYMNAFLSAVYNINRFRSAVYSCEPTNATTVLLAQVFAKMQTNKSYTRTRMCLMPAIRSEMGWEFDGYHCNIEFGGRLMDLLPDSVKELYKISLVNEFKLKSNNQTLKSKASDETHLIVPLSFPSISQAIAEKFIDREAEDYFIEQKDIAEYAGIVEPFEGDRKYFPINTEMRIANRPEILVFGIRRKTQATFNNHEMRLDSEFTLPADEEAGLAEHTYVLQAFCYHTIQPLHYISYVRDFVGSEHEGGNWYSYNDKLVTPIRTQGDYDNMRIHADRQATLAFYVRRDVVPRDFTQNRVTIPARIAHIAKFFTALEDIKERKDSEIEQSHRSHVSSHFSSSSSRMPSSMIPNGTLGFFSSTIPANSSPIAASNLGDDVKTKTKTLAESTSKVYDEMFPIDCQYFNRIIHSA